MNEQPRQERATDLTHMSAQRRRYLRSLREESDQKSEDPVRWATEWTDFFEVAQAPGN